MKPVRPQNLVHRGVVDAAAFYFATPPLAAEEAQRRILSLWVPGAIVYRISAGLLLRLPTPRRVVCSDAPGLPLTLHKSLLLAAPFQGKEITALAPPDGSVVLIQGSVAVAYLLTADQIVDPATWLDLGDYRSLTVESLGEPPAVPIVLAEPVPFDARARFSNIPAADPERQKIIEDLRQGTAKKSGGPGQGDAAFQAISQTLGRAFSWLSTIFSPERSQLTRNPSAQSSSSRQQTPSSSPQDSPWDTMRRLAARFLRMTGLSGIIGRRQAQYLNKMMELFERGELQDALRYAIPLKSSPDENTAPPELGVPTPRDNLQLTMQPERGQGSSIGLSEDLFGELRTLYRRAITKLEAEGRIEEAAFILADLLQEYEEAIALLERHQLLRLAAQLAEGHTLPPGLVVRLWFLAGDTDRAVQIARRTGTFADAVLRLERTDKARADVLRGLWAQERARAGDYPAAIEIIWSLESARSIALEWIRRASEGGGAVGGRMLARRLLLEESEEIRTQAITLLEEKGGERALERQAFAEMLPSMPECASARPLARLAVRTLWSDTNAGWSNVTAANLREVQRIADDGGLRADMPPLPHVVRQPLHQQSGKPLEISVAASDTGSLPISDAAYLPNGQCLVALGEAGTRLVSRDGRTIVHFDQPAHRLVISDSGNHAIGLAQRGSVWRLARFDLTTRRATTWKDATLRAFAPNYDGSLWFVGIENDLMAIDATSNGFDALWRMPNIEGEIVTIARNITDCSLLIRAQGNTDTFGKPTDPWVRWERWHYVLPSLTLRDRGEVEITPNPDRREAIAVSPEGVVGTLSWRPMEDGTEVLRCTLSPPPDKPKGYGRIIQMVGDTPLHCTLGDEWVTTTTRTTEGVCCLLQARGQLSGSAFLRLNGANHVSARLTPHTLTLCDDLGRLLVLSLTDGTLLRNLRLS